jgi:NADH-quinone oxidoreductase subunit N
MVNYYDVLKVSPKASGTEIKSAYRRLARKLHPDRNNGSEETALKFAAIAEAYEVLGNAKERVNYDRMMLEVQFNNGSNGDSVFASTNPHAKRWRQMVYEKRYNDIIDRMIAEERHESLALQRFIFPLVALFISTFFFGMVRPAFFLSDFWLNSDFWTDLLGILAGTTRGYQAAMFYTITYVIMAIGSFGMIIVLSREGFEADKIEDFRGLNKKSPWFAAVMAMLMFSTAGVPPFVGFWARLAVLGAVLAAGLAWLAAVSVLFSVIAAYYYLRIVKLMYFDEPTDEIGVQAGGTTLALASLNGIAVLALGLFPSVLIELCARVLP